jgi:hypothetical protein
MLVSFLRIIFCAVFVFMCVFIVVVSFDGSFYGYLQRCVMWERVLVVKVLELLGGVFVTAKFEGTPEEVEKKVRDYFKEFPFAGYSTMRLKTIEDSKENIRVYVERLASCD